MAGIYIHIPFCLKKCVYCNFHSAGSLRQVDNVMTAMLKEIDIRKGYLSGEPIKTIYIGGGTPSLVDPKYIELILTKIFNTFKIEDNAEITIEANPDDITIEKLLKYKHIGINRFSLGIQSFDDKDLVWLQRRHSASKAIEVVNIIKDAGFENISIDLIYGIPHQTDQQWEANINKAIELNVSHISAYSLTVEEDTALYKLINKGNTENVDDNQSARQFLMLINTLESHGYQHYEISNFCKPGMYSQHNTNYWKGEKYLGIGPSAHSYDGKSRQWNIANNIRYAKSISEGVVACEKEELSINDRFNEYVMVSLRTMWGIDIEYVKTTFGEAKAKMLKCQASDYMVNKMLVFEDGCYKLTSEGKLLADGIISDLFETE